MRRVPYIIEKDKKGEKIYDLYSRLLKDRIVFVVDALDSELANDVVAQLLLLEAISLDSPVYMYINSPGGSIDAMYAIYDTMEYVACPVYTIGYGRVQSAASFLVAAGEKGHRIALPNTNFMIHQISSGSEGKYRDIKNYQNNMDRTHKTFIEYFSQLTGQNKKKLEKDLELDYYMTVEEAMNYGKHGIIDAIQTKSVRKVNV